MSAGTAAAVDTRHVAGVPCLTCSAGNAKEVLALLRAAGWHPNHHSRLVLDRRPGKHATSWRAYQISDEAAATLVAALAAPEGAASGGAEAARLLAMIGSGDARWCPLFQLHEYIIAPDRCDRPGDHGDGEVKPTTECAEIMYLPGHALKPELAGLGPEPQAAAVESAAAESAASRPGFTFAELFAGIGGFRVGLAACGGQCVFSSEINPWCKKIYALNFGQQAAGGGGSTVRFLLFCGCFAAVLRLFCDCFGSILHTGSRGITRRQAAEDNRRRAYSSTCWMMSALCIHAGD